jgi:glycosyltransferase involved in cell wall biosynthesis
VKIPNARIECTGFVPYTEVVKHLQSADLGIVPYEESTGTHCAFVAKIVEYLAVGLPVVSTSIIVPSRYFGNEPTVHFAGFDGERFGAAMVEMLRNGADPEAARRASERVRQRTGLARDQPKAVDFVDQIAARKEKA